jgi:hypothetical protein
MESVELHDPLNSPQPDNCLINFGKRETLPVLRAQRKRRCIAIDREQTEN